MYGTRRCPHCGEEMEGLLAEDHRCSRQPDDLSEEDLEINKQDREFNEDDYIK